MEEYAPWFLSCMKYGRKLKKVTGEQILTITGLLIMASVDEAIHHRSHFFNQTVAWTEKYSISHHLLDVEQIKARFPQ